MCTEKKRLYNNLSILALAVFMLMSSCPVDSVAQLQAQSSCVNCLKVGPLGLSQNLADIGHLVRASATRSSAGQRSILPELVQCASSLRDGHNGPYRGLFQWWTPQAGSRDESPEEALAVTFMTDVGSPRDSRPLITLTQSEVLVSEVRLSPGPPLDSESPERSRLGSLSIDLRSGDTRARAASVDPRNLTLPGQAIEFTEYPSGVVLTRPPSRLDLLSNRVEINRSHAAIGSARGEALETAQRLLRERLLDLPSSLRDEYGAQKTAQNQNLDELSPHLRRDNPPAGHRPILQHYIRPSSLELIREALCDCGHSVFRGEVDRVRSEILRPNSPLRVWDADLSADRPIEVSDLACTMS